MTTFDDPHARAKQRIATGGVRLFVRLADEPIVHVQDRQQVIAKVMGRPSSPHHLGYPR